LSSDTSVVPRGRLPSTRVQGSSLCHVPCAMCLRSLGSLRCLGSLGSLRSRESWSLRILGSLGVSGANCLYEAVRAKLAPEAKPEANQGPRARASRLPRCRWRPSKKRCLETGPSPSGRCPSLREADDVRRDRLIGFVKHFLRSLHDSKSRESWSLRSLGSRESWSLRIIGSRPLAVFWNASVLEPLSHGDSARIASRSLQAPSL